ncbi:MAG: extracellular solute-binding protein [Oscillospiraceae bacterium]|nr:extracellular solute-binding protein [Oscillospiraceae bacterium]
MKSSAKRVFSGILAAVTSLGGMLSALPVNTLVSYAQEEVDLSLDENTAMYVDYITYSEYLDIYGQSAKPDKEILINGADFISSDGDGISTGKYGGDDSATDEMDYESDHDVLIWNSSDGEVTYKFNVEQEGIYNMQMLYYPIVCNVTTIEFEAYIDGILPFETAQRIELGKAWKDETDVDKYDKRNNQIRPAQVQDGRWLTSDIKDVDGLFNDPLYFYLEEGEHELTLVGVKANFCIDTIKFYNQKDLASYNESEHYADSATMGSYNASETVRIEGEDATYKTHSTLYATYDRNSYLVSPADPTKMRYNTIGADNWDKSGQSITWQVSVEQSGYYKVAIKAKQDEMRGFASNRRIYLNGEVLFEEFDDVMFYYDNDWNIVVPTSNSGEEIYIFLEAGKYYDFTMEAIPGAIGESMRRLDEIVLELNTYYRKIIMITSPDPDKYTDYSVHTKIPELVDEFARLSQELKNIKTQIESISGSSGGSEATAIERMTVILDKCVKNKYKIPNYLSQIKENVTSLSSWMRDYRDQPLEIDYIEFVPYGRQIENVKESDTNGIYVVDSNMFKSMGFHTRAFFGSFFEDYNILTDESEAGAEPLNVWVSLARDQAQVVKELVESDFVPEYGISVSVNLVQGTIMEATLAGQGPDIALFVGGEFPVNLAVRGLLVDMNQFSDFEQVKSRFQENATVMYTYDDKCYGLPITQSFAMMFYRTDILTELGFTKAPETWDELIEILPALQRNNLGVGLVKPTSAITASTESGHTFATLLLQKGTNYYNQEQTQTLFDSIEAVQAFEQWTDFYTKYKFSQTYDEFSYFRTGEYPIVVAQDYNSFFNQLSVAAPEISGLWDFTYIPGTVQEDGSISHAVSSTGAGAIIFECVDNKEDAWKFVSWFTDTDTQVAYANNIEGLMGQMGRVSTANLEALAQLSWSTDEYEKIAAQMAQLEEISIIPASYVVTRSLQTAFRETVNNAENPRDTLMWYNKDINSEIARKRKNLGLD